MRILYSFPHRLGAPGIGTTAVQQVRGLLNRGHEVQVVAASTDASVEPLAGVIRTMVVGGVRIPHRVFGMDRTMIYHDHRVAALIRRNAASYDVVHCWPGAALSTSQAAAEFGIPSLREVPNTHPANSYEVVGELCTELGIELPRRHSHRLNIGRLRREQAEHEVARRLLVPSEHVKSTFLSRGFSAERLARHQYGFDAATFTPSETRKKEPFHAVFLGAIEPRKGLHVALEAWRRSGAYQTARLSIHGKIVPSYMPIIEPYLTMPNVELCGFAHDVAKILRGSDVLILPSFEEGSALVTYEAQGCGVVPMVSDATGAPCVHGTTGLIHRAGDVAALGEQISGLIQDRPRLEELRQAVLDHRDRLTWSAAAERLEACYREAISAA